MKYSLVQTAIFPALTLGIAIPANFFGRRHVGHDLIISASGEAPAGISADMTTDKPLPTDIMGDKMGHFLPSRAAFPSRSNSAPFQVPSGVVMPSDGGFVGITPSGTAAPSSGFGSDVPFEDFPCSDAIPIDISLSAFPTDLPTDIPTDMPTDIPTSASQKLQKNGLSFNTPVSGSMSTAVPSEAVSSDATLTKEISSSFSTPSYGMPSGIVQDLFPTGDIGDDTPIDDDFSGIFPSGFASGTGSFDGSFGGGAPFPTEGFPIGDGVPPGIFPTDGAIPTGLFEWPTENNDDIVEGDSFDCGGEEESEDENGNANPTGDNFGGNFGGNNGSNNTYSGPGAFPTEFYDGEEQANQHGGVIPSNTDGWFGDVIPTGTDDFLDGYFDGKESSVFPTDITTNLDENFGSSFPTDIPTTMNTVVARKH